MEGWIPNGVTPAWRLAWARTQVTERMLQKARDHYDHAQSFNEDRTRENIAIGIAAGSYSLPPKQ